MTEQQLNAHPCAEPPIPSSGIRHINRRHPDRFTVVGNHLAQHHGLSLTAMGLALHIQSLPAGAKVSIKRLADRFPEGEVRIAAALRELEAHGYLTRTRERLPSGQVITRTVSYNNPPAMAAGPPPPRPAPAPPEAPLPHPEAHATAATTLLTDLRRHDPRLLLAERDVRRLAPAATAWLDRGITPEAVRRTLTAGLPATPIHHPAALLAHRLTEFLPPPLPAGPTAPPRPDPLQNCDHCDRAFRAPRPGHCRDCAVRSTTAAA